VSFGSQDAAVYDVKYQVNVGEFEAQNKTVEAVYARTTAGMSDGSLRAAIAQEKLDRAIAQHGPTSLAAKSATLAYRREMAALGDQSLLTGRELQVAGRGASGFGSGLRGAETDLNRFGRGMLSGSGLLHGLGRAAAFASTTFLGGAGLVFAIRSVIHAQQAEEVAVAQVKNALRDSNLSWSENRGQITKATDALETHTGFTKEELLTTLANLIRRTGDVNQSLALTGTATDLARGRNIALSDAGNILIKALNGQTSALKRMGLEVTKVTTAQDALHASGVKANAEQLAAAKAADAQATKDAVLAQVKQKYGAAAAAYLQTEAGKQALLNAQLKDSEAIIGRALEPTIEKLLTTGARRLEQMNKDGSLQRDVNHAVKDGTQVVHGLTDAFHLLEPPISGVIHLLGGLENAAETALVLGLALKARKASGALGLLSIASGGVRKSVVADAALEGAALGRVRTALGGLAGKTFVTALVLDLIPRSSAGQKELDKFGLGPLGHLPVLGPLFSEVGNIGRPFAHTSDPLTDAGPGANKSPYHKGTELDDVYQAGLRGTPLPFRVPAYGPEAAAYLLGQTTRSAQPAPDANKALHGGHPSRGAAAPGKPSSRPAPPPTTGLSFKVQQQLLDAQISGKPADQLAADQAAEAELHRLLAQPGLTHADILTLKGELAQYTGDASSVEQSIHQAEAAAAAGGRPKKSAAQRAYASGISTHASGLRDDVTVALKLEGKAIRARRGPGGKIVAAAAGFEEPVAQKKLVADYERESHDPNLTGAEQARYHTLYIDELAKVATERDRYDAKVVKILAEAKKKEAERLKTQQSIRDLILQNRLSAAQLAQTQAGTNAGKVKKAQRAELAAELAILKRQEEEAAKLTGLARQEKIAEELATRQAIAQLKNGLAPGPDLKAANEAQFLTSVQRIVGAYAPNAFPAPSGKTDTHLYEAVHELRQIKGHLATAAKRARFPGSHGSQTAVEAAFG
jgi:hypothetical protein